MNPPPITDRPPTQPPTGQASRLGFWLSPRGLLAMVTIAAFMYVSFGLGRLFAEWREAAAPIPPAPVTAFELNPLVGSMPLDGAWTFADLAWNVRSTIISEPDLIKRLQVLATSPSDDFTKYPDVSPELLDLVNSLHLQPVQRSGNDLYAIDRNDLKAQLLVRKVDGHTKVLTFAGAYPHDGDRWQMFELTPRIGSTTSPSNTESHLLPLPPSAIRRGGRFADDSRLLLELVSLNSTGDALLADWQSAGWEVRPSGFGSTGSFSYLCARGDEVIYAWSASPSEALQNIMLVRSPTDAELAAQQLIPTE